MDIEFNREPGSAHMILNGYKDTGGYKDKMVENNKINALLDFSKSETTTGFSCWYDISGKNSLKGYFAREGINIDSVMSALEAINDAFTEIRKYLLEPDDVVLSEETVYLDYNGFKWEAFFAYMPTHSYSFSEGLEKIAGYLIENVNHEDEHITKICYQIYERTVQKETTIRDLTDMLGAYRTENIKPDEEVDYMEKLDEYEDPDENLFVEPAPRKKWRFRLFGRKKEKKKESVEVKDFFEEYIDENNTVTNEYMESATTILMPQEELINGHRLIYEGHGNKSDICIEGTTFKIGSREMSNDAVINEGVISRSHARITTEGDCCYIEDLESKNGTFVNGQILDFNKKIKLSPGDLISFANIGYRFE